MDEAAESRWYTAWRARDVDAILDLYAEGVEFSSPFVTALGFSSDGVLYGKPMLRAYVEAALSRAPTLSFEPVSLCVGARGHTLLYRNHTRAMVCETHELDGDGLIIRADVCYQTNP